MSNIVLFNMITLDGFFAEPNGDINWHRVDEEFNQFAIQQTRTARALIFGRVTYQLMAAYWPTPAALTDDPIIAGLMNSLPKIVFSRTLQTADWNNTRLVKENVAGEIRKLKQQPGGDLLIFGSANLAASLIHEDLIDEYRLMVCPLVLGRGLPLFQNIHQPLNLTLAGVRTFQNGNLLLVYQPDRKGLENGRTDPKPAG